ncbi:MAG: cytochrome P450 [Bradymonadaceae bacterium]|nr:cytochrome P450 [Lujinxingiaceae bacterium]
MELLPAAIRSRAMTTIPRPPGPKNVDALIIYVDFMSDPLRFFTDMAQRYGDFVYFRLGFENYEITDPRAIEQVLVTKSDSFTKDAMTHELEDLVGHGLLTSEGELWKRQRRLAAPALQRKHIASYAETMVAYTETMVDGWANGDVRDVHKDLMELTLRIVVKTLFNVEIDEQVAEIGHAIEVAMEIFHQRVHTLWRFVPERIPTPSRRRYSVALDSLDEVIYGLIARRRESNAPGNDLLYRLLQAADEDGNSMSDRQLRDEAITMFLAGHETTALAVSYAWYLLTRHPESAQRLHEEVDAVLGDRSAGVDDVASLEYTKAVILETMRLYPPAWIIGREASRDVIIGDWLIPKGAQVLMPQYVMHRDIRWFSEPDTFLPERWLDGLEKRLPRYVYFPFGGGTRVCIGTHFAMMEAILLVAAMAQKTRLHAMSRKQLQFQPSVTLRPASPIKLRVERR